MLRHLFVGFPTAAICLVLQALFLASCLRRYVRYGLRHPAQFEGQRVEAPISDFVPLGPIEAANGILTFGLSTAVMSAAVLDALKNSRERILNSEEPPAK